MQITLTGRSCCNYKKLLRASTGHPPFYLNYGEHPNTPIQMDLESHAAKKVPGTTEFLSKLQAAVERAKLNTLLRQRGRRDMQTKIVKKRNCVLERKCGCPQSTCGCLKSKLGSYPRDGLALTQLRVLLHLLRAD